MAAVTHQDLQNLEIRVKSEISKEQIELRHEDRKKLSDCVWTVDSLKTDSALSKQSFTTMTNSVDEIKILIKEFQKEVKGEFKAMHDIFATKEEHKENKIEIESIKATHWKIISWVVGTVGTIFLAFLGLIIKTLWLK